MLSEKARVLVVDDEKSIRMSIQALLDDNGISHVLVESGEKALEVLEKDNQFHVVLLDIWLGDMDGFQTMQRIKASNAGIPVIMMSGHGNIEMAVQATKEGAYDFLEKPFSIERLLLLIEHAKKEVNLLDENQQLKKVQTNPSLEIIGKSPQIEEVKSFIQTVALSDSKVFIYGENGTGKELVARRIHGLSLRAKYPLVALNSAAIPEELIESELFGFERGAFTHALKQKIGKFELAHRGTLFLDEIADMSLKTQAKILRVLQEGVFQRVGGNQDIKVDVRVIAATNKDLQKAIADKTFREDLFYRINILPVTMPPLRERAEDIPLLVDYLMEQLANIPSKVRSFHPEAMVVLKAYSWPGNVRELRNLIERIRILVRDKEVLPQHLPEPYRSAKSLGKANLYSLDMVKPLENLLEAEDFQLAKRIFEKSFIEKALDRHRWNISKTAKALGLERSHLHKKMKLYSLVKNPS